MCVLSGTSCDISCCNLTCHVDIGGLRVFELKLLLLAMMKLLVLMLVCWLLCLCVMLLL